MPFDPNNMKATGKPQYTYQWATYIPNRSPQFKVHGMRGHATAACKAKAVYRGDKDCWEEIPHDVVLYTKGDDGKWVVVTILRKLKRHTKSIIVNEQEPS